MKFPYIPEDFDNMDSVSFNFDDFVFRTDGAEAVQSSVGTSAATRATEITGTSSGAFPYPSSSQSNPRPPRLSQEDPIPIIYSPETHA